MASYFDPSNDVNLIHSAVRSHSELETVAGEVEYEIIDIYTFPTSQAMSQLYQTNLNQASDPTMLLSSRRPYYHEDAGSYNYVVWLDGYRPDADDDEVNPLLKEALQRTVANVTSHRLLQYDSPGNIKRERRGRRTIEYATEQDRNWQESWDRMLAQFDMRPAFNF